jgi:hypothetical protein
MDGYGFHQGYFHPGRYVWSGSVPRRLRGYARRAFDQGLGRSLWFVAGADGGRIGQAVRALGTERADDLWGGVGLAAAYAGGVDDERIEALIRQAGGSVTALSLGAAFAAAARARAGNPAEHTDRACRLLAGCTAETAAALTFATLRELPPETPIPRYEAWRQGVREALA